MPEDLKDSAGDLQISEESELHRQWPTVEDFVKDLGEAIEANARIIRETDLSLTGGYRSATITVGPHSWETDVFVDRLGRVVMPGRKASEDIEAVTLQGKGSQKVLNKEPRYRGNDLTAWVLYLEPLEIDNDS